MPFLNAPPLLPFSGKTWVLHESLRYFSPGHKFEITVPEGFDTDLDSTPWMVKPFLGYQNQHVYSAILHDWLYRFGGRVQGRRFTRRESDDMFLEAMEGMNVTVGTRSAMYRAVRMFGGIHWKP